MTKQSEPLSVRRIESCGVEPPLPPALAAIPSTDRASALLALLKDSLEPDSPVSTSHRLILSGFFFGEGQQPVRFAAIAKELRRGGFPASPTTPKNNLDDALDSFCNYAASSRAEGLLSGRFAVDPPVKPATDAGSPLDIRAGTVEVPVAAPSDSIGLSDLISTARHRIEFCALIAGRSVAADDFRLAIQARGKEAPQLRFLLLDPNCEAFSQRAAEENDSVDAWRMSLHSTIHRLSTYRDLYNCDIEVKVTNVHPIWRLIIVDSEKVFLNTFLEGKRGTESMQYELSDATPELVAGFSGYFRNQWRLAMEVSSES